MACDAPSQTSTIPHYVQFSVKRQLRQFSSRGEKMQTSDCKWFVRLQHVGALADIGVSRIQGAGVHLAVHVFAFYECAHALVCT